MVIAADEARRRALRAAAKATLSLSVLGCGPATPAGSVPSEQVPVSDASGAGGQGASQPLRTGARPLAQSTCDVTVRASYPEDTLRCCGQEIAPLASVSAYQEPPPTLTPTQAGCCFLAIDAIDKQDNAWALVDGTSAYTCCSLLSVPGNPLPTPARVCSPWGPPMPPAMPAHLLASEAERSSTMSVLT